MMRGVNHFGAALMDGKPAECAGCSGSDGDACISRSQLARAAAGGALRPARVVLNAGGEWGTFLPTTSYPMPPGKPQLTAGARGNEAEKTTGPETSSSGGGGGGAAGAEGLAFRWLGGCS